LQQGFGGGEVFTAMLGSRHVIASLRAGGIDRVHPLPLYRIARLERIGANSERVRAASRYDWERHKVRDGLLGALEPLWEPFLPRSDFVRLPGLTLGVVSRITPIEAQACGRVLIETAWNARSGTATGQS
jgi:hypothetical protein